MTKAELEFVRELLAQGAGLVEEANAALVAGQRLTQSISTLEEAVRVASKVAANLNGKASVTTDPRHQQELECQARGVDLVVAALKNKIIEKEKEKGD